MAKLVSVATVVLALALSSCSDAPEVDATADDPQPEAAASVVAPDGSVLEPFDTLAFADVETQTVEVVRSVYMDVPITWEESDFAGWALDPTMESDSPLLLMGTFITDEEFRWDEARVEMIKERYREADIDNEIEVHRYSEGMRTYEIVTVRFTEADAIFETVDMLDGPRGFNIGWAVEDNSLYDDFRPQVLTALRSVEFEDDDD